MATNQEVADYYAQQAIRLHEKQSHMPPAVTGLSGIATAHAVLALLDYIQQDDTMPSFEETVNRDCQTEVEQLTAEVRRLEEELNGAYAALRAREEADAAEMKTNQDLRRCDSIWRGGVTSERVRCDRLDGHPGDHHGFDHQNMAYRWPDAS